MTQRERERERERERSKLEMTEEDVVVVGAGIAGLATAVALKRVGVRALVLERSEELRATGAGLSLFPNAFCALDALGVSHKLTSLYASSTKGCITNIASGITREVSFGQGLGPIAVHRKALLEALAEELPNDAIRFSSKLTSIEMEAADHKRQDSSGILIHLDDGTPIKAKVLVGCDGVHSVVAQWLGLSQPAYSGRGAARGLALIPEGHGLSQDQVHQFVDTGKRAGLFPLNDKEVYWFFSCKSTPQDDHDMSRDPKLIQKQVIEKHCRDFPAKFLEIIQQSDLATLTWAPLVFRYPWNVILGKMYKGGVTVAGDAMHPMTPDLGQGGCAALEDAVVLGRHIGELFLKNKRIVPQEVGVALKSYVNERRWRAAGLITGSYLSGWAQQVGNNWWMKFLRDVIFYKFLYPKIFDSIRYDCGTLPRNLDDPTKMD